MLSKLFDARTRKRQTEEDLIVIKHALLRQVNIAANKLFLLQCFLDEDLYDKPGERLITGLQKTSIVKLIGFYKFVSRQKQFRTSRRSKYESLLRQICNSYADGLGKLNDPQVREELETKPGRKHVRELINDLLRSSADCEARIKELLAALREEPTINDHHDLVMLWQT